MSARELVLGSIRQALGVTGREAPRRKVVADRLAAHPTGVVPQRGQLEPKARVALLAEMIVAAAGTVAQVERPGGRSRRGGGIPAPSQFAAQRSARA